MQALAMSSPVSAATAVAGEADDPLRQLIRRGEHRDALALAARLHGAVLGRLCMAMLGSRADADEATQEALLAAHRSMASYRGDGSVKAWLCGIARHVCARRLEQRRAGARLLAAVPADDLALDAFAVGARAREVRAALAALRPSEREPLILRYVADLDYAEVGAALGVDEPAARKRVSRALARLRDQLSLEETP